MRRIAACACLLTLSAPVFAGLSPGGLAPRQTRLPSISDTGWSNPSVDREIGEARQRIDQGRRSGSLTRREARGLAREADQITTLRDRYGRNGMSGAQESELEMRARSLQSLADAKRFQSDVPAN
jgi:hypothetical protein